jgi:hypothetical protein
VEEDMTPKVGAIMMAVVVDIEEAGPELLIIKEEVAEEKTENMVEIKTMEIDLLTIMEVLK